MAKEKNKGGRPPTFRYPKDLMKKADEYFEDCDEKKRPYTVAGLCYFLGFADKCSFTDNEKRSDQFSYTIKRIRMKIEAYKNEKLLTSGNPTAGVIFDLKNNHGWTDKQEIETTEVIVVDDDREQPEWIKQHLTTYTKIQ